MLTFATGQGADEQEGFSDYYFWLYFLIVHLLALYGFISLVWNVVKWMKPKKGVTPSVSETEQKKIEDLEQQARQREQKLYRTELLKMKVFGLEVPLLQKNQQQAGSSTAANEPAADEFVSFLGQGERYHRPN